MRNFGISATGFYGPGALSVIRPIPVVYYDVVYAHCAVAFSALTLLVGHLDEHPACIKIGMVVCSEVQMICTWFS